MTAKKLAEAKRDNSRRHNKTGQRGVIKFFIVLGLIFGSYSAYHYFRRLPFDAAQWKASGSYQKMSIRERMSDSLLNSKKLDGLNHFQVVSLLGKPDQYDVRDWNMGYIVGFSIIDPVMLVIRFDKQKRVVDYDVQTFD